MARIGIYAVSSQSGGAFLADLVMEGVLVYGYARPSQHGRTAVNAIHAQGGIQLDRPENELNEPSHFIPLNGSEVGHHLERLARTSDLIIFAHPSHYHEETVRELAPYLLSNPRPVPLVLSPSRTLGAPYLWKTLGEGYPIVAFQTCPYTCKSFRPGSVYIKRRKRAWVASFEGNLEPRSLSLLRSLYPHMVYGHTPAATSLGNIGAVLHPAGYLLNLAAIQDAAHAGRSFLFYMEGIAHNPVVGPIIEEIDQIRLQIADRIGCKVFGLRDNPREDEWLDIMRHIHELEENPLPKLREHRQRRAELLQPIHDAVVSCQHWLAYTYGVHRIPGESLPDAIGRNTTFQHKSVPQDRYAHEDVPTGLVPLEALARRLSIPCEPISHVIDVYREFSGIDARETGRNLRDFDLDYLRQYLRGELTCLAHAS